MDNIIQLPPASSPCSGSFEVDEAMQVRSFEPFVDELVVARFLQLTPRRVLEMARKNEIPAHPIGHTRKTWRFRMSEIDAHFSMPSAKGPGATIMNGSSRNPGRKQLG
jgi:hypothetical protein